MLEAIRIALGFAYAGICVYTIFMVERHHKEDHEDVLNARRDATNKSCENWSALYDYAVEKAEQDATLVKIQHQKEVLMLKDQIKALEDRCDHYEQELARINIINGKLWDAKKEAM